MPTGSITIAVKANTEQLRRDLRGARRRVLALTRAHWWYRYGGLVTVLTSLIGSALVAALVARG